MIMRKCFHTLKSFTNHSTPPMVLGAKRRTLRIYNRATFLDQKLYVSTRTDVGGKTSRKEKLEDKNLEQEDAKALTVAKPRQIFEKEFPDYFSEGKFINRISYVDFVDQALARLKDLGLEKNLNAYKELLRVFPPGKYHPSPWDFGLFHAPQQLCAIRVLHQMSMNKVQPDREVEKIVIQGFSQSSAVWVKCARMNYWSMKLRNLDPNPLPEKLPEEPHQLAKLALLRMLGDQKTTVITKNTSSVPTSVDKTWVVYCQNSEQTALINKLEDDSTLYIEDCGYSYVNSQYLSYYALKYYVDEEEFKKKAQKKVLEFNFNTLKMKFYGKPLKEKLVELEEQHYVDGSYILAIGATGTSSNDSILSWLKIMEQKIPKLSKLKVVFRLKREVPESTVTTSDVYKEEKARV